MMMYSATVRLILLNFVIKIGCSCTRGSNFHVNINATNIVGQVPQFWKSTGFSPPNSNINETVEFMHSKDLKFNLALIGSLPNTGIKQVRIHWLLDLVAITKNGQGNITYNFTELNKLMKLLTDYDLNPGFEIMGNPSKFFNDFEKQTQTRDWYNLIKNTLTNYIEIYGVNKVSQWNFETWNEPDLKMYNTVNFSIQGYLNYVNATISALKDTNTRLKIGGPAGLFKDPKKHQLCWVFLKWCDSMQKFNKSCPVTFISFHKKGNGSSDGVTDASLKIIHTIREQFSSLGHFFYVNNEADILTGWWKNEEWRNDTRYAAMVLKVIIDHQKISKNNSMNYPKLLSNDNGFLNYHPHYFSQRTLLSRFQINNTSERHVEFFKKPIYILMGLLSYLGDNELQIRLIKNSKFVHILATRNDKFSFYTIVVSITNDTVMNNGCQIQLVINMEYLQLTNYKYVVYTLNSSITNPATVWKTNGAPDFPDDSTSQKMRESEGPYLIGGIRDARNTTEIQLELIASIASVFFVQICPSVHKDSISKSKVTKLKALNITYNKVLLTWKDKKIKSKCLKTYEIQFANQSRVFRRINQDNTIFLSYVIVRPKKVFFDDKISYQEEVQGYYRVRAIDYWNQKSRFSNILHYTYFNQISPKNQIIHSQEVYLYENQQKPSSFKFKHLLISSFILPMAIVIIYNYFNKNSFDFQTALLGITLSLNLTAMLTNFLKILVGRPRPDFLSRCFPSNEINLTAECTGNSNVVREGRKSFPSGHSSMAFASLGFLAFYLAGKLHLFGERKSPAWKLIVFLLPLMLATTIALSRISDNRHHWQDVLVGSLLGLSISYLSYKLYFPKLTSEYSHRPLVALPIYKKTYTKLTR